MGARAWLIILALGLGSVVAMGIMTKVAVESNPELQAMIRFKAAFAADFENVGVEEVQLRKAVQKRGHVLLVSMPEAVGRTGGAALDAQIAEYFVSHYDGKPEASLGISYQTPSVFGCVGPDSYRKVELPLAPVRIALLDRKAAQQLSERCATSKSARLIRYERSDRELLAELEVPKDYSGDWKDLAFELEPEVRGAFGANLYLALRLRFVEARKGVPTGSGVEPASPAARFEEVRFDRAGREIDEKGKPTGRHSSPQPVPAGGSPAGPDARSAGGGPRVAPQKP